MQWRRPLVLFLLISNLLFGWLFLAATPGSAHSNLVRSEPPANAQLSSPPHQIQLWFSEAPELKLSTVQVVTPQRRQVDAGNLRLAPNDPESLIVDMPDIPTGTYAVIWHTTSKVDGHVTQGVFAFAYGDQQAGSTESALESLAIPSPPIALRPDDAVIRWLNLAGMSLLTGGLAFYILILAPALRDGGEDITRLAPVIWSRIRRVAGVGIAITIVGTILALLTQAAGVAGVSLFDPAGWAEPLLRVLDSSRYGTIWIGRAVLLLLAAGLIWRLPMPLPSRAQMRSSQALGFQPQVPSWINSTEVPWRAGLLAGVLLLLTTSLNSHGAATRTFQPLSTLADWVHLTAAALWIGGLAQLVVTLPAVLKQIEESRRRRFLRAVIGQFTRLGQVSVAVLVLTGLYAAWLQVGTLDALRTTLYGQTLLVKLLLIVPLLGLAAVNMLLVKPALAGTRVPESQSSSDQSFPAIQRRFQWAVRGEMILTLLVLLVAGFMTGLPPSTDLAAGQTEYATLTMLNDAGALVGKTEHYAIKLDIAPGTGTFQDYDLNLSDARNESDPPVDLDKVVMQFTYLDNDTGTQEVDMTSISRRSYHTEGGYLSLNGHWWLDVMVRPKNGDYEKVRFDLVVDNGTVTPAVEVRPALQIGPAPAHLGVLEQFRLTLEDEKGAPITDATISLEELMPAHAHIQDATLRNTGGGVYVGSSVLTMSGRWIIVAKVIRSDGSGFERQWELEVQD